MNETTFKSKRFSFFEQHLVTAAALGAKRAFLLDPNAETAAGQLSKNAKEELPEDFPLLPVSDQEAFFAALSGPENLVLILPTPVFSLSQTAFTEFLTRLAPFCKPGSTLLFSYPGGSTVPSGFPGYYSEFEMATLLSSCGFRLYDHAPGPFRKASAANGRTRDLPYAHCLAVRKP